MSELHGLHGPGGCAKCVEAGWNPPGLLRVARSLDDLQVGQVVALVTTSQTAIGTVGVQRRTQVHKEAVAPDGSVFSMMNYDVEHGRVFILKDANPPVPPAADWLVPADTMEALREALGGEWLNTLEAAARAVLDAAREVER